MSRLRLCLVVWGGLSICTAAACAADPWQNCQIMPKSDQLLVRTGQDIVGDVYQIAWPATVEGIEGQWLWVVDKGPINLPAACGWVRKDDVLKLGEAQAYYMDYLRTADAPWVHWLVGICLEKENESAAAQQQYLKALSLGADRGDEAGAMQAAVEMNPNLLDAAIGVERVKSAAAKSADEASAAADQIQNLTEIARRHGIRRPHAFFQQAEALNKAYRLKLEEERSRLRGIDDLVARATSEKDGGTADDQALFKKADELYRTSSSLDPSYAQAGPHIWKGCMGRAELYMSRVDFLNHEVWSLIGESGSPAANSATAAKPANRLSKTSPPLDLEKLEAFTTNIQDAKPGQDAKVGLSKAHAACFCLAAEILALQEAVKSFDQAVAQSTDLVDAYRDRGLAYLSLARCEATLSAILTALEKVDPDFQKQIAALSPDGSLQPQELDSALVNGRRQFDAALDKLLSAKAKEARIATQKQEIAGVAADLAKNYVADAVKHGDSTSKEQKKADAPSPAPSSLLAIREQLQRFRSEAAEAAKAYGPDELQARQDISQATAALDQSYAMLNKSRNLQSAEQSARTACSKGNFSSGGSLQVLAETYASRCNFDRAEYYQKLAVIFASEDERPQLLQLFHDYTEMDDLLTAKAKAKTLLSSAGPGKGAKPASGDSGGGDSAD